jgi:cobalt-zinc-cadmium efflux system membrane fusion protein
MTTIATTSRIHAKSWIAIALVLNCLAIALGYWLGGRQSRQHDAPVVPTSSTETIPSAAAVSRIRFSTAHQQAAGVRTVDVDYVDLAETIAVTGKLAVNDDRLGHLYSIVEGVLRAVNVRLGDDVKEGQTLAIVDSKEVGQAKLDLARNRMIVGFAKVNFEWMETVHKNTQGLIADLQKNPEVTELETRFQAQPMGENRQLLVSAYAKYHQTKSDYERLKILREQQVGVEKDYIRAKADYESASATYGALLEQLKYTTLRQMRESEQKLQETLTAEQISRSQLLILGYTDKEIDAMDPLVEGEAVAHYPIRAPFAGSIIGKHAVLSEHVGPQHQLFEMTDLSKVWLHADVFEKDLANLAGMTGKTLKFRTTVYPGREFTAEIFRLGDSVDEKTRAVTLIGTVDNAEGLLKPGMFAEVILPAGATRKLLQVPAAAVQRQNDENYVFVRTNNDEFERRAIQTGRTIDGHVEVLAGLTPREQVVVEGAFALKSEMLRDLIGD